jgi:hypothetical protein
MISAALHPTRKAGTIVLPEEMLGKTWFEMYEQEE